MSRFNQLPESPLDQVMISNKAWPAFKAENPDAINTGIGVLVDDEGDIWRPQVLDAKIQEVAAEERESRAFGYQSPSGNQDLVQNMGNFVFGHIGWRSFNGTFGVQTLGGTHALRVARDAVKVMYAEERPQVVHDGGWANHIAIFDDQNFEVASYRHLDPETGEYDHQAAIDAYSSAKKGSTFLLQVCGYNDDGMDRSNDQWVDILNIAVDREATIIMDSAYLGLARGISFEEDRFPLIGSFADELLTFVAVSASKNMGLYRERIGSLLAVNLDTVLGSSQRVNLSSIVNKGLRKTVSNPPYLMAEAAARTLKEIDYMGELNQVQHGLVARREEFAAIVEDVLPKVSQGKGLFIKAAPTGFNEVQQAILADRGIHALPNGRINLGGIPAQHIERVGEAVRAALKVNNKEV